MSVSPQQITFAFAPLQQQSSQQALQSWSRGNAQLQVMNEKGWSALSEEPQTSSGGLLFRMGDARFTIPVPDKYTAIQIRVVGEEGDCAIMYINNEPWVGFCSTFTPENCANIKIWLTHDIIPDDISQAHTIAIFGGPNLRELPPLEQYKLHNLYIFNAEWLYQVDVLQRVETLNALVIQNCGSIRDLHFLEKLKSLQRLHILWCGDLETIPHLSLLPQLVELRVHWCGKLSGLYGLDEAPKLELLDLQACNSLRTIPIHAPISSIKHLTIGWFRASTSLPYLPNFKELNVLNLTSCIELQAIPALHGLDNLQILKMYGNIKLKKM